jgi:hypothetical protein
MKNIPPPPPRPRPPSPTTPDIHLKSHNSSPSMFDHIKQGFGFGLGNAISHKVMDSVFNNPKNEKSEKSETDYQVKEIKNTKEMYELYNKCLEENKHDIDCNDILKSKI